MQMERTTAALMAHLKLHNTAASKMELLGDLIAASPGITAAGLRDAMDKAEINPATKECANKWLADQKPAPKPQPAAKTELKVKPLRRPNRSKPVDSESVGLQDSKIPDDPSSEKG